MAQIDGSSNSGLRPYRSAYGAIAIRAFEESTCASSKIIQIGDIVTFDTLASSNNARLVVAPSSQGAAGTVLQNGINSLVGVAVQRSTSDGSTTGLLQSTVLAPPNRQILVAIADGITEFAVNISSVGADHPPVASSMIGNQYAIIRVQGFDKGGHGCFFLDSTNSTAADQSFVVTDVPSDQIGTTGGYVVGKFLSTMVSRAVKVGPVT
jgi:hypothetical protein